MKNTNKGEKRIVLDDHTMRTYYHLDYPYDSVETGKGENAQLGGVSPGYDRNAPNSWDEVPMAKGFPPDDLNLDYLIVDKKATMTDAISPFNSGGFLLSPRLKSLLEGFNLPPHKFYPARLLHKQVFYDYFYFHVVFDYTEHLEYGRSRFGIHSNKESYFNPKKLSDIHFASKEQMDAKWVELRAADLTVRTYIQNERLIFNQTFSYDIFYLSPSKFIISDLLYMAMKDNQITGLLFEPSVLVRDSDEMFND